MSEGLGAKAESCAGGLPTEDAAKGKLMRGFHPIMKFVQIDKEGFNSDQDRLLGGRTGEFFISARRSHREIFLVTVCWLRDGINMESIVKSSAHGPHSLMKCVCSFRFALAGIGRVGGIATVNH